ncbi:ROK family transcriptional regulator [Deinococcus irradiatisoli]|uniref:ROK family transcriptional regulator n=1 Tax=Deinococcus irradiatisoli TaxID=2202254 RepID=A0A2Z3JJ71_9DEIO|nr:ROK family protein [Deinococcus irradiatisoli]AWN23400.1 ROK family transcriptional regulator [Deinococcus irradiatisoli]
MPQVTEHAALDQAAIRSRHLLQLLSRLWAGDLARVDLARELHLSRSAVSSLVSELIAANLVKEGGVRGAESRNVQTGRRATLLSLNAQAAYLLAVDVGASHLRVDVLDLRCVSLASCQIDHDVAEGPAATYARVAELSRAALKRAGIRKTQLALAGVSVPGPVAAHTGQVMAPHIPGWNGVNVGSELGALLGLPTLIENDANLGVLAEYRFGAHRGEPDLLYLKLATGIGAGIMFGGQLYRGSRGGAGEIGHIAINEQGPVGRSGSPGSLESYAAAQVLLAMAAERRAAGHPTRLPAQLSFADLLADPEDPLVQTIWREVGHHLGVAISTALNLFNPGAVVLGGRLAQAGGTLLDAVRASAAPRTMGINHEGVSIDLSRLGADAGVLGVGAMLLGELLTPRGLVHLCEVSRLSGEPDPTQASRAPPDSARSAASHIVHGSEFPFGSSKGVV